MSSYLVLNDDVYDLDDVLRELHAAQVYAENEYGIASSEAQALFEIQAHLVLADYYNDIEALSI